MKIYNNLKNKFTQLSTIFMFVLIAIQPLLDVLSYFCVEAGNTSITTALRMLMFAAVVVYAFVIAERKKPYIIMAGVLGAFWICHMVACFSEGYISLFSDMANYIRFIQIPVLALCFITLFKAKDKVIATFGPACALNMATISLVVILSIATGNIHYTYDIDKLGWLGWFSVGNAQSMIVSFIGVVTMYWAYTVKRRWVFPLAMAVVNANLFTLGTKVAYFTIFIIVIGYLFGLVITKSKRWECYLALILIAAISATLYPYSIMVRRNISHDQAFEGKDEIIEDILDNNHTEDINEIKINGIYLNTYVDIYEPYCGEMIDTFGVERVLEKYNYTISADDLAKQRLKKQIYAELCWEDSNFLTHLFGYEYETLIGEKEIYDLENDFPSVFYYYGYVGFAMFCLFLAYFALLILVALIKRFKDALTMETIMLGLSFVLLLGTAQLSGNVLRRPNVSIYLSLTLAYIYHVTTAKLGVKPFPCKKLESISEE